MVFADLGSMLYDIRDTTFAITRSGKARHEAMQKFGEAVTLRIHLICSLRFLLCPFCFAVTALHFLQRQCTAVLWDSFLEDAGAVKQAIIASQINAKALGILQTTKNVYDKFLRAKK
tara:strand:- start:282 stop:632 length:351 start_codon:yes stop_codon:yes gene_type:complete